MKQKNPAATPGKIKTMKSTTTAEKKYYAGLKVTLIIGVLVSLE